MKSILTLVFALCMNSAFAEGVTALANGDISIYEASSTLTSVQKICGAATPGGMTCMAYGSIATVKVTLSGCADRFAGHFSRFEVVNGKGYLFFGALSIYNKASNHIRCVQAPTQMVQVQIPFEGAVQLVPMEYTGTTLPQR